MLTAEQITDFREQGYLHLRNWISNDEVEFLLDDIARLRKDGPSDHPEDFIERDGMLNRIHAPMFHSSSCLQTYGSPKILGVADSLYDGDFATFAESVVVKLPGDGGIEWHQDGNFKAEQTFDRGINMGIYLHASRTEDGCVYTVPGSHLRGPAELETLATQDDFLIAGAIPVEAERGDVLVHSRSVLHGADRNRLDRERITYYVGFHHRPAVVNAYSEESVDELMQLVSLAVQERTGSGRYPDEVPFSSPLLPVIDDLSDDERETLTRGLPRHGF